MAIMTPKGLQRLRRAISENRGNGPITLREFGKLLGEAIGRRPYDKSTVCKWLNGTAPISARGAKAARIMAVGLAGFDGAVVGDPMPRFEGGPVARLKAGRDEGVDWQTLYVSDANVRNFIDTLVELICRG